MFRFHQRAGDRSPELYRIAGDSAVCGAEFGALAGLPTSLGPPDRGLIYNNSDMDKTKLEAIKKDVEAHGRQIIYRATTDHLPRVPAGVFAFGGRTRFRY